VFTAFISATYLIFARTSEAYEFLNEISNREIEVIETFKEWAIKESFNLEEVSLSSSIRPFTRLTPEMLSDSQFEIWNVIASDTNGIIGKAYINRLAEQHNREIRFISLESLVLNESTIYFVDYTFFNTNSVAFESSAPSLEEVVLTTASYIDESLGINLNGSLFEISKPSDLTIFDYSVWIVSLFLNMEERFSYGIGQEYITMRINTETGEISQI